MTENSIEYVYAGKVAIGKLHGILTSTPLGSCVAVVGYDKNMKIGGMAHVMLPGKPLYQDSQNRFRYAFEAVPELLNRMIECGAQKANIGICLVGGANVLRKKEDQLVIDIIKSVYEIMRQLDLKILKTSLGGFERRTASINLEKGEIQYSVGDHSNELFYTYRSLPISNE